VIVRDLDMSVLSDVRRTWAFYRDRRPDSYGELVTP
jgi:N-carbamoylputrescine amidase